MAAPAIPVKGKPGTYYIPTTGQLFRAQELTEDSFFDSVVQGTGSVSAGTKAVFFNADTNKNFQHTNITTVRRIPSTVEFSMTRLGLIPAQAIGNTLVSDSDILKSLYTVALKFNLGKQEIARGPAWKYPAGYGATGSTTRTTTGVVSNGVASAAAVPPLVVTQPVNQNDDLDGDLRWDNATWITSYAVPVLDAGGVGAVFTLDLHGIKKTAVSR